jgi:hypothetical protein
MPVRVLLTCFGGGWQGILDVWGNTPDVQEEDMKWKK